MLRDVRAMANLQAALILRGVGGLVGVARRLHRITLGDRPFVIFGLSQSGEQCLDRALDGMLYGVDHDPAVAILVGWIRIAAENGLNPKAPSKIERAEVAADRLDVR